MSSSVLSREEKLQLAIKEVEILQTNLARFDQNGLKIQQWALTNLALLVGYSFTKNSLTVALLAVLVTVLFALIELNYRRFQERFVFRLSQVESILKKGDLSDYSFAVNRAANNRKFKRELVYALRQPQFRYSYLLWLTGSCGLSLYIYF